MKKTVLTLCLVLAMLLVHVAGPAASAEARQVTAWGNYCTNYTFFYMPSSFDNQTLRAVLTLGISGSGLTIEFSNKHGAEPVVLDHVSFAPVAEGTQSDIVPDSAQDVLFSGETYVSIPAGETVISDVITVPVQAGGQYAVSYYIAGQYQTSSGNAFNAVVYTAGENGDHVADAEVNGEIAAVVPYLRSIRVITEDEAAKAFVIVGDSTSSNAWPGMLQARLEEVGLDNISVIPRAVSGNRLMVDAESPFFGEGAVNRFDEDVYGTDGVFAVLIKIGVNDLFHPVTSGTEAFTVEEMIAAEEALAESAHAHGLKVYMMTITPFNGYESRGYGNVWTEDLEQMRLAWNDWIRTTDCIDGYVDLCPGMTDPADATMLLDKYTVDHLHPSDLGLAFITNAVPLEWFVK
ncbi:MAG: hypothetical protein IJ083_18315 [Clostridia bacterium]|nr:hypothetical protein [Clostridia bacterium]